MARKRRTASRKKAPVAAQRERGRERRLRDNAARHIAAFNASLAFWGHVVEDMAGYAQSVSRELLALGVGRADLDETIRHLSDLARDHWERMATLPARLVAQVDRDLGARPRAGRERHRLARAKP